MPREIIPWQLLIVDCNHENQKTRLISLCSILHPVEPSPVLSYSDE